MTLDQRKGSVLTPTTGRVYRDLATVGLVLSRQASPSDPRGQEWLKIRGDFEPELLPRGTSGSWERR